MAGLLNGKPWQMAATEQEVDIAFSQFGRFQGFLDLPPHVVVKNVSVRVMEGSKLKATETVKL